MNNIVLITGSSTGIGRETALYFAQKGWKVAATMRNLDKETELQKNPNIQLFHLDVTNNASIKKAVETIIQTFDKIDVLVNNAGFSVTGIFEGITDEDLKRQFDTNVFGLMQLTKEVLPYMRHQKSGCIVNVSSIAGKLALPLFSVYHATKFAVEGFSESLQYELRPFNIKVKLIEPGIIYTDFYERSMVWAMKNDVKEYEEFFRKVKAMMDRSSKLTGSKPIVVAKEIYKAAISNNYRLRYPVGGGAVPFLLFRNIIPGRLFRKVVYTLMNH